MTRRWSLFGLVLSLVLTPSASGQEAPAAGCDLSASDIGRPAVADRPAWARVAAEPSTSENCPAAALSSACCDPGFTYAMAEALYYGRDNASLRQPVVIDLDRPADDNVLLTTRSLQYPFEPGIRARLGYQLRNCRVIEAEYMGLFGGRIGQSVAGEGNLAIPGDLGRSSNDFFDADGMDLSWRWELHSGEVNWVNPCECCCSDCCGDIRRHWRHWFVGFRYLSLDEEFNIQGADVEEGTSNYNIRTHNDLYGLQIGGRWGASRGRLGWEWTGKAGLFGNAAGQTQFVTDFPPPFLLRPTIGSEDGQLAFVGELGCSLLYQLTTVWSVRGGYNLMWIEGVALAPDQLDFTNTATSGSSLTSSGGVFLHGANMGIEARW